MNVMLQLKKSRKYKTKRVRELVKNAILERSRGKELGTGKTENRKKGEIQT